MEDCWPEDQVAREIKESMAQAEGARPAFDDDDIQKLGNLIRLTVRFYHYLTSQGRWPAFPEDPWHDLTYVTEPIFWFADEFLDVLKKYDYVLGKVATTIDWDKVTGDSLRDRFLSMYPNFIAEKSFARKCRLLLDLYKLQIIFAGMYFETGA